MQIQIELKTIHVDNTKAIEKDLQKEDNKQLFLSFVKSSEIKGSGDV